MDANTLFFASLCMGIVVISSALYLKEPPKYGIQYILPPTTAKPEQSAGSAPLYRGILLTEACPEVDGIYALMFAPGSGITGMFATRELH